MKNQYLSLIAALLLVSACKSSEAPVAPAPAAPAVKAPVSPVEKAPISSAEDEANEKLVADIIDWELMEVPDLWIEIPRPKELFTFDPNVQNNTLAMVKHFQDHPANPFKIVVLKNAAKAHAKDHSLDAYVPPTKDLPLHDYFNGPEGYKFTAWHRAETEKKTPPAGEFLNSAKFLQPLEDGTEYRYPNEKVALISAAARYTTVIHEMLHGFYNSQLDKDGELRSHAIVRALSLQLDTLDLSDAESNGAKVTELDRMFLDLGIDYYTNIAKSFQVADEMTVYWTTYEICMENRFPKNDCLAQANGTLNYLVQAQQANVEQLTKIVDYKRRINAMRADATLPKKEKAKIPRVEERLQKVMDVIKELSTRSDVLYEKVKEARK